MSDDSTADLLLAARDIYAEQGGGMCSHSYERAPYCALGALRVAAGVELAQTNSVLFDYLLLPHPALRALIAASPTWEDENLEPLAYHRVTYYNDIDLGDEPVEQRREKILDLYDSAIRIAKDGGAA